MCRVVLIVQIKFERMTSLVILSVKDFRMT